MGPTMKMQLSYVLCVVYVLFDTSTGFHRCHHPLSCCQSVVAFEQDEDDRFYRNRHVFHIALRLAGNGTFGAQGNFRVVMQGDCPHLDHE